MRFAKLELPIHDVDEPNRVCISLNRDWLPIIMSAVSRLEYPASWKPGTDSDRAENNIHKLYTILRNPDDDCADNNCYTYGPEAPFIEWFPNNPFTSPDLVTDGYLFPAWYLATPLSNTILGTQDGDVVTDISRIPIGSLPTILPASGLPRFRINLSAPGLVRLHLLNVLQGSMAQITIDDRLDTIRFIDLNRDQVAIPAETSTATIEEIEVLGAGAHHIDVIIVSMVNDEIPFIYHGGGLRKIEICGEAAQNMPYFELRQNPDNPCLIEQKTTVNGEFFTAYDLSLCQPAPGSGGGCGDCNCGECDEDDDMELRQSPTNPCVLEARNKCGGDWYTVFDMSKCSAGAAGQDSIWNEIWQGFYDGTPQSINPNAPSTAGGDDEEKIVLCSAVKAWVYKSMINAMNAVATVLQQGTQAPVWSGVFSPLWTIFGGIGNAISIYQFENMLAAFNSTADMTKMICELTENLNNSSVSKANLEIACNALTYDNINQDVIKGVLTEAAEAIENYFLFVAFLSKAVVLAAAGVEDCPCDDLDPVNPGCGDGCTQTTDLIQWNSTSWIQKGENKRTLAGTPVGQFDSFDLGGLVEAVYLYPSEVCIKQVQISTNHNTPAVIPQIRLKIGQYEISPQTPASGTSCLTNTVTWSIPAGVPGNTIRLLQLSPVTEANKYAHRLFCMKVTRCTVS